MRLHYAIIFRYVDFLHQNYEDKDNIWKFLKAIRKNYLSRESVPECRIGLNLISESCIKDILYNLTKKSKKLQENKSKNYFDYGATMFIYLSFCPPKKLIKFYRELLAKGSIRDMILALTNIMKTRRNAEKSSATKLWSKLEDKLKFLNYKKLESLTLKTSRHSDSSHGCETKKCSEDFKSLGQILNESVTCNNKLGQRGGRGINEGFKSLSISS